ncbi:MAG: hypothetical protein U1E78_11470 [Gammaproteobacteria bacterium]
MYQVEANECQNVAGGVTVAQISEKFSEAYRATDVNVTELATVAGIVGAFAGFYEARRTGRVSEYLFQPVAGAVVYGALTLSVAYVYEFAMNTHQAFKA